LEWATTSPPPAHNFDTIPPVKGRDPLWQLAKETGVSTDGDRPHA